MERADVLVVGAGIVGLATARAVLTYGFGADILGRIGAAAVRSELDEVIRTRLLAGAREAAA